MSQQKKSRTRNGELLSLGNRQLLIQGPESHGEGELRTTETNSPAAGAIIFRGHTKGDIIIRIHAGVIMEGRIEPDIPRRFSLALVLLA